MYFAISSEMAAKLGLKHGLEATPGRYYLASGTLENFRTDRFSTEVMSGAYDITVRFVITQENGYECLPGRYQGDGYDVTIDKMVAENNGSSKTTTWRNRQTLNGSFKDITTMHAFYEALLAGEVVPSTPLQRKLSDTEAEYARAAADAVKVRRDFENLKTMVIGIEHHQQHTAQVLQNVVTTMAAQLSGI
jgi:hypothetical protein